MTRTLGNIGRIDGDSASARGRKVAGSSGLTERMAQTGLQRDLASLLGADAVLPDVPGTYLTDRTEARGIRGRADAVVLPSRTEEVRRVVAWCYEHDVPIVPRGGGTGLAGGCVPLGGVVVSLERLRRIRSFEPQLWRIHVDAGLRTADLRRVARESGLLFPPDPGAAEQSQIGGNIATNAGGPHSLKYGATGAWVTGIEAVVAPGEIVTVGGPFRKDVAGYDLKSLLIGSEGTLAIITAAWLRLTPAPEASLPVVSFQRSAGVGCAAVERVLAHGLGVSALEFIDGATLAAVGTSFPTEVPPGAAFVVIAEVDGSREEAARLHGELVELLKENALHVYAPSEAKAAAELWRWRDGISLAVTAKRGGKVSEDIVVPLDRLAHAIEATFEIGLRHRLDACSWGHAGDGNLHSTFLVRADDEEELRRARLAAEDLFALATRLGGSVSGEHGIGLVKREGLSRQLPPKAAELHAAIKHAFDPKGLLNPGKKLAG